MSSKCPAYDSYKQTESRVGLSIPEPWKIKALKHLTTINMGQSPASEDCNQDGIGIPFLQGNAEFGADYPTPKQFCESAKKIAEKSSYLLSVRAPVGALNTADQRYGIGRGLCGLIANSEIGQRYLYWSLLEARSHLTSIATGSTFEAVSAEQVGNTRVVLPPLEEQTQIAKFLDYETAKIDALIEKQQQLIALLKEKRQAVISHAITKGLNPEAPMRDSGVEWLGEVPAHWEVDKLYHLASRIGDGLHGTPSYQDGTGLYFVNGNNLEDGRIVTGDSAKEVSANEYHRHHIPMSRSTVLLSINGTIGKVAIYADEQVVLGKSAAYINCLGQLQPRFLQVFFQSHNARRYYELVSTGTTISNLSLDSIRQLRIGLPNLDEQVGIVEFCTTQSEKYDDLIAVASAIAEKLHERRTALISAAVTGKIDVRGWKAPESEAEVS